jgi:hypothetical protein
VRVKFYKNTGWAIFWEIFSKTHPVTLVWFLVGSEHAGDGLGTLTIEVIDSNPDFIVSHFRIFLLNRPHDSIINVLHHTV